MEKQNNPSPGRPPVSAEKRRQKPNITLDPQLIIRSKKRAGELAMGFSELVTVALERFLEASENPALATAPQPYPPETMSIVEGSSNVIALSSRAHIIAAAGSPITAEVTDWDTGDGSVLVRISGLSMAPMLNDGDVITMRHKAVARSPFMKKGLIYLVSYDDGYTVKRYNTRKAKAEEMDEEWVTDGKVKVLESINPEFPEIVIKQPLEWIAWLDEEKR